jgi:biotin carboxyl carrier protein
LQTKLHQAFCGDNKKAIGMPEIKIITEVAGRVCATPVQVGGTVADGDDVVVVEAMKMEIPVSSPAAGTLTSLLVKLDDVVAEGQAIAIVTRG